MSDPIQEIVMRNGVAVLRTFQEERVVPLGEYIKSIETRVPVYLPVLPRTVAGAFWDETDSNLKKVWFLCELAPALRTISKVIRHTTTIKKYRLPMPWTFMWFEATTSDANHDRTNMWSIGRSRVFYSPTEYRGMDSRFIKAMVPNLRSNGEICWGSTGSSASLPLDRQIDDRVNGWYLSNFNGDYDGYNNLPHNQPFSAAGMKAWVDEGVSNPAGWKNWEDWTTQPSYSVRELLGANPAAQAPEMLGQFAAIPDIDPPWTFGRWEDWWRTQVPVAERLRARRAFENLDADVPDFAPDIPVPVVDENDDGGVIA